MRFPRMTTRRWMIATALVGLCFGVVRLKQRSDEFASIADEYSRPVGSFTPLSDEYYAWREAIARKYERAARYPWLPVKPDPPEPE